MQTIWTPQEVENYLKKINNGSKLTLPNDAYITKNFTWNEVLRTNSRNIDMPPRQVLDNLKTSADVLQDYRNKIGKPITITSSWRTPQDTIRIRNEAKKIMLRLRLIRLYTLRDLHLILLCRG